MSCLLAVALALGAGAAAADVVICTDGTRYEGEVAEQGDLVTVKTEEGLVKLERAAVFDVLHTDTSLVDRFLANPTAGDLLVLASRAGLRMGLEDAEGIVKKLTSREDVTAEAEILLHTLRLTPEHTRAIVEKHVAGFKEEYGERAAVHEGEHYVVLSPLGGFWSRKVGLRMDGIFEEYQKRLVFKEKVTDRFVVKVYGSRPEYVAHGAPPRSQAYFSSGAKALVAYRQASDDQLFESLYHEGMHQFLHFYVPNPPIWFDEGLAQYFETAKPRPGRGGGSPSYQVGRAKRSALDYLQRSLRASGRLSVWKLVSVEREKFYGARRSLYYAEAWAFTHFLVESGNKRLKQLWMDYFFALRDGADQKQVNRKVFGKVNIGALETALKKYVGRLR